MEVKTYIGIDNGVTGSIGIISDTFVRFHITPTFSQQDYTKTKKNITRIDTGELRGMLSSLCRPFAVIERPMVNPGRFNATTSALRALEATLCVLESLDIGYMFVDSKQWQKELLPAGIKGPAPLKKASLDIGKRFHPEFASKFKGDADGLLIAIWAKRMNL